jgi:hypothetical protein
MTFELKTKQGSSINLKGACVITTVPLLKDSINKSEWFFSLVGITKEGYQVHIWDTQVLVEDSKNRHPIAQYRSRGQCVAHVLRLTQHVA